MAKYSMKHNLLFALFALSACTSEAQNSQVLSTAIPYIGHSERYHREELKDLLDVDPVYTQWCAAFVNSVLQESGIPSLNQPGVAICQLCSPNEAHPYPLAARSFLHWGSKVDVPEVGDIVVFPRGPNVFNGHVGFYLKTVNVNGIEYYSILGGNQDNKVSIKLYKSNRALGIRRYVE